MPLKSAGPWISSSSLNNTELLFRQTALAGRTEEEQEKYDTGRLKILPDMILATAKL